MKKQMEIRKIISDEIPVALDLAWRVFRSMSPLIILKRGRKNSGSACMTKSILPGLNIMVLFKTVLQDYPEQTITVNSSPYGVPFYHAL